MSFDFPTMMVIAAAITGMIWALDAWLWAPARRKAVARIGSDVAHESTAIGSIKEPLLVEYARSFFPIIFTVLVLRSFLVEPFRIPSGSMIPTLMVGDFILVNKFVYGFRLPVINKKIINMDEPHRGDVVVFRYPKNPSVDYIKRVVGLPGDRINYVNKTIYINNEPMRQEVTGPYYQEDHSYGYPDELRIEYFGDKDHQVVVNPGIILGEGEYEVPNGHYFMMGDNRDRSNDSRFWGVVPEENLVGKAFMVWMSWRWDQGGVIWGRIGKSIN
ncbi:signal peptidase I [Candidatus Nitrosoglobus terrae]|uniref:Signal peptidase I n=1 Tax=Candidatus Nitrosoglobus terrae TaxID=1630141 RepID=A0A1Q2SNZ9_9GAMM|nr:signal peptidase I [Candidatus Nitrosoglobus terrae]BAW80852.1 signal peptidase I [Candidatus Nitrosoglobus terrae]